MATGDEVGRLEELLDAADAIIDSLRSVLVMVKQRGMQLELHEELMLSNLIETYDNLVFNREEA